MMKCIARAKHFKRCQNDAKFPFFVCHLVQHKVQILVFIIITIPTFISTCLTIYDHYTKKKEMDYPIDSRDAARFKALVIINSQKLEENPVHPESVLVELTPLIHKVKENGTWEKSYSFEVALLFRTYSAAFLASGDKNNWYNSYISVEELLERSLVLFRSKKIDEQQKENQYYIRIADNLPMYREAITDLKNSIQNFDKNHSSEDLQKVLKYSLILSMPTSNETKIKQMTDEIYLALMCIANESAPSFKYLINAQNSLYMSFGHAINYVRAYLQSKNLEDVGGNELYFENRNNNTQVEYCFIDNQDTLLFAWEVSKTKELMKPITEYASILTEYFRKHSVTTKSMEILFDNKSSQQQYDRALDLISKGFFYDAILILIKITIIEPTWAEPHWFLSKALFGHISSIDKNQLTVVTKMLEDMDELPIGEREREYSEFLKSSQYEENAELNQIALNAYPEWMAKELKRYVEIAPNGQFAQDAETLIQMTNQLIKNSYNE